MGHTYLRLKSREMSFVHDFIVSDSIVLKVCTKHGSDSTALVVKFQNDSTLEINFMEEQYFAKFASEKS